MPVLRTLQGSWYVGSGFSAVCDASSDSDIPLNVPKTFRIKHILPSGTSCKVTSMDARAHTFIHRHTRTNTQIRTRARIHVLICNVRHYLKHTIQRWKWVLCRNSRQH
jgi:hypothetical protein